MDTAAAYQLLVATRVPPQVLAVVWEMANRSRPGQLTRHEFMATLAMVALLQVSGR